MSVADIATEQCRPAKRFKFKQLRPPLPAFQGQNVEMKSNKKSQMDVVPWCYKCIDWENSGKYIYNVLKENLRSYSTVAIIVKRKRPVAKTIY